MRYKNSPKIPVREYLERIHGVDILSIFVLSDNAGLTLLAETGTDLSKWANENKFVGCRTTEAVESMSQHQNIGG